MRFFYPGATPEVAETLIGALALLHGAPNLVDRRIWALYWHHQDRKMACAVGHNLPPEFDTGMEIVVAILECASYYKICTSSKGSRNQSPILIKNLDAYHIVFFEPSEY